MEGERFAYSTEQDRHKDQLLTALFLTLHHNLSFKEIYEITNIKKDEVLKEINLRKKNKKKNKDK